MFSANVKTNREGSASGRAQGRDFRRGGRTVRDAAR